MPKKIETSEPINAYFSLNDGIPIARVYGGPYDGTLINIIDEDEPNSSLREENNENEENSEEEYSDEEYEDDLPQDLRNSYLSLSGHMLTYDKENRRSLSTRDQLKLETAIKMGLPPKDKNLLPIYHKITEMLNERKDKEIIFRDGSIQPIPTTQEDQVDVGCVSGPMGAGKSTYISKWCIEYQDLYPDNKIYLFSRKKEDKVLDIIPGINRVLLDKSFLDNKLFKKKEEKKDSPLHEENRKDEKEEEFENDLDNISVGSKEEEDEPKKDRSPSSKDNIIGHAPLNPDKKSKKDYRVMIEELEEETKDEKTLSIVPNKDADYLDLFKNSCCIFDDIDTIQDNAVRKKVLQLRDDLIQTGRSNNIHILSSSHLIMDREKSKMTLNECTFITFFPSKGGTYQIQNYLLKYQGLTREQINRIKYLPSRWVSLYTRYPRFIIYESGAYFL